MANNSVNQEDIVVSVFMLTYLHADYIKQAINGVLIQECKFPIELIVADDMSPDNTKEVVLGFLKNHPKKHIVRYTRHKKNKGMHGNFQWMTDVARGKYIAQCEGDDYWIDPHKLQKQVEFLEGNPDYGLVYTKAKVFDEKTQKFWNSIQGRAILNKDDILYQNPITSLTTVYRSDLNQVYLKEFGEMRQNWKMGDYPKWIWFNYNSKIHFIDEVTAVYRKLENSASNFSLAKKQMAFKKNTLEIQDIFAKKYLSAVDYTKLKNYQAFHYYYIALKTDPTDSRIYYDEIKDTVGLNSYIRIKLFLLEKLNFKRLYTKWIEFRSVN